MTEQTADPDLTALVEALIDKWYALLYEGPDRNDVRRIVHQAFAAGRDAQREADALIVEQMQRTFCDIYGGHTFDPKFPDHGRWIEPVATAAAIRSKPTEEDN